MSNEVITLKASDYGLEESKAKSISDMFQPMLRQMVTLEEEFNDIAKLEINEDTCEKARLLRREYVKVRTGTAEIHKGLKAFYLQGGRFVDGWKNAQIMASQGIEEKLSNIEKHFDNLEKEKAEKLRAERYDQISKFMDPALIPDTIGSISSDVWDNYLNGAKASHKAAIEAKDKEEKERIEREKAEHEEREKIKKDNERLRAEAVEKQKQDLKEAQDREKIESKRIAKEQEERKKQEQKLKAERDEVERIQKDELAKRIKLEAKLKAAHDEEEKRKRDEEAAIQMELKKGDSDKIVCLCEDLQWLKTKYSFKAKKNKDLYSDVSKLLDKTIGHIKSK